MSTHLPANWKIYKDGWMAGAGTADCFLFVLPDPDGRWRGSAPDLDYDESSRKTATVFGTPDEAKAWCERRVADRERVEALTSAMKTAIFCLAEHVDFDGIKAREVLRSALGEDGL